MVKKILIALVCLCALGANGQNATISPYSYFGVGDIRNSGTVENQMMAGLQMYADSIHLNLQNPAAYSSLRLTAYTAGISHKRFGLKDANEKQSESVTNLDYLSIGFPIAKNAGIGFGLMPYTSVGYNLNSQTLNEDGDTVTNVFAGEGGINRVYLSLGYQPFKDISIGATVNYNFGELEYQRIQSVEDVQFGTLDTRTSKINGFDFNYALNYTPTFKDKYTLYAHVGVNTQVNLVSKNNERLGSFSLDTGADIEVIDVDLDASGLRNTELKIPTVTTLGLGYGENKKWFIGGEYTFQQLSSFSNDFLQVQNVEYTDASSFALGSYFIPDYRSISSYFNRITYRAGLRYDKTGMVVNNEEINNFGITFGFGLPLGSNFSNINLGFELGKRGTTDAGLIEENYFKINVGLSLNDKWFIKRKIN
ncbi:MAG: hypothetical protein HKP38_12270 [Croceitalea sp.]|nr:hypothetical protein [Croceitalea sp.]MBT8237962.1 hypothetical protein [Croceitalea sp.]NNC35231.1 hypothetical protein [Croceitalea sp.]NNL09990.1 hypothetical protein [Croceitalea sp.]NNM17073.1 hypothetical protein [Croceitalea sp.]